MSMFPPSWISEFLVSVLKLLIFIHKFLRRTQSPWTKARTSVATLRTGTRASKIHDGEDVDDLTSPVSASEVPFLQHKNI